jgi:hypothetical protein
MYCCHRLFSCLFLCSLLICRLHSFYPSILFSFFFFLKNKQSECCSMNRSNKIFIFRWICRNVCDDRRWSNFNILTLFYRWKKKEREKEQHTRKYQLRSCKKKMMAVLLQSNSVTSIEKNLGRRRHSSLSLSLFSVIRVVVYLTHECE